VKTFNPSPLGVARFPALILSQFCLNMKHESIFKLRPRKSLKGACGADMYDSVVQEAAMSARPNRPVSVTLGPLAKRAEARVKSGAYASLSEVVRAGLRALDREEATMEALLRARVEQATSDTTHDVPLEEAFARMDRFIAGRKGDA
jgi:antitoxin ParD1/3/4